MNNELPDEFTYRMKVLLGEEFESFEKAFEGSARKSLCISELKTSNKKFQAQAPFQMEPVTWLRKGYYFDPSIRASAHPYYHAGVYYITEASAMTPADRFPIDKGDKVLDLCAAPGGKSFALLGKLNGSGLLVANEVNRTRAKALVHNLENTGCSNMIITCEQPVRLEKRFTEYFDKILVDAPCSGEGMFRRDRTAVQTWSKQKVEQLASLQKSILSSAVKMLRPGGKLMYSTCTFSPEENERNVSWLLDTHPEMKITKIEDYELFDHGRSEWSDQDIRVERSVRIWPHRMEAEGQFMALFQKVGSSDTERPAAQIRKKNKKAEDPFRRFSKEEQKLFLEFSDKLYGRLERECLFAFRSMAFLIPVKCPDVTGLTVLRKGLLLGEFKKDRFEPSQSLAYALSEDQYSPVMDLKADDERVRRYLKGETLENLSGAEKGWVLIRADGYSLGFGKVSGNLIKNKLLYSRRLL